MPTQMTCACGHRRGLAANGPVLPGGAVCPVCGETAHLVEAGSVPPAGAATDSFAAKPPVEPRTEEAPTHSTGEDSSTTATATVAAPSTLPEVPGYVIQGVLGQARSKSSRAGHYRRYSRPAKAPPPICRASWRCLARFARLWHTRIRMA